MAAGALIIRLQMGKFSLTKLARELVFGVGGEAGAVRLQPYLNPL